MRGVCQKTFIDWEITVGLCIDEKVVEIWRHIHLNIILTFYVYPQDPQNSP